MAGNSVLLKCRGSKHSSFAY